MNNQPDHENNPFNEPQDFDETVSQNQSQGAENQPESTAPDIDMKKPKKKKFTVRRLVTVLIFLAVICGGFFLALDIYGDYSGLFKPYGSVSVTIPKGANTDDVIALLKKEGVIKYPTIYKIYIKLTKQGGSYRRGMHSVTTDLGYAGVTGQLKKPAENTVKVTIPEGFWQSQIVDRFIEKGIGDKESWSKALLTEYDFSFLKGLFERNSLLEGYLFPDTYEFFTDDTPEIAIQTMLSQFDKVIKELELEKKAEALGMTLDETVKLASIIQSEVPSLEEMKKVSAVFHNRLNIEMKLQSCVTVLYAIGEHKGYVTIADTKVQSPYNTYYVEGLPAGPISSPGREALAAAVAPDSDTVSGNYLFFYSPDRSTVLYTKTYAEHLKVISKNKGGTGTATVG